MSSYFGLGKIAGPSLKAAVITSIIGWFIKSCYIHFAGVILFPNKNTNFNFRKTLILTGLVQSPLIFNFFVFGQIMLPLVFVTYIWYNICLIKVDFPDPLTPVTTTKHSNGIFMLMFLRLFS